MSLSKQNITSLINKRRHASLMINIENLQLKARHFDLMYEEYTLVPPETVPQYVYRYWFMALLTMPRPPKAVGRRLGLTIYAEPRDAEWMWNQLLE